MREFALFLPEYLPGTCCPWGAVPSAGGTGEGQALKSPPSQPKCCGEDKCHQVTVGKSRTPGQLVGEGTSPAKTRGAAGPPWGSTAGPGGVCQGEEMKGWRSGRRQPVALGPPPCSREGLGQSRALPASWKGPGCWVEPAPGRQGRKGRPREAAVGPGGARAGQQAERTQSCAGPACGSGRDALLQPAGVCLVPEASVERGPEPVAGGWAQVGAGSLVSQDVRRGEIVRTTLARGEWPTEPRVSRRRPLGEASDPDHANLRPRSPSTAGGKSGARW